jgi:hypothetical protein
MLQANRADVGLFGGSGQHHDNDDADEVEEEEGLDEEAAFRLRVRSVWLMFFMNK